MWYTKWSVHDQKKLGEQLFVFFIKKSLIFYNFRSILLRSSSFNVKKTLAWVIRTNIYMYNTHCINYQWHIIHQFFTNVGKSVRITKHLWKNSHTRTHTHVFWKKNKKTLENSKTNIQRKKTPNTYLISDGTVQAVAVVCHNHQIPMIFLHFLGKSINRCLIFFFLV